MTAIGEMTHWLRAEDHELMINEIADAMVTRKIGWRLQNCKSILSFLSNADWNNWFDCPIWTKCQRILFNKAVILVCGILANKARGSGSLLCTWRRTQWLR